MTAFRLVERGGSGDVMSTHLKEQILNSYGLPKTTEKVLVVCETIGLNTAEGACIMIVKITYVHTM